MIDPDDNFINDLIIKGAIEVVGVDRDTGELLYAITKQMKDILPEGYDEHLNFVNQEMMGLWEKGYVDIDFMSDDPIITITAKALDINEVSKLSKQEIWSLDELKRIYKQ